MKSCNTFPLEGPYKNEENPIAIFSGDLIHILYPNGEVEVTTTEKLQQNISQRSLEKCLVWGCFEEF